MESQNRLSLPPALVGAQACASQLLREELYRQGHSLSNLVDPSDQQADIIRPGGCKATVAAIGAGDGR